MKLLKEYWWLILLVLVVAYKLGRVFEARKIASERPPGSWVSDIGGTETVLPNYSGL